MKKISGFLLACICTTAIYAQVQIDKALQLTGTAPADAKISGVKEVSAAQDAVSAEVLQKNSLTYAAATGSGNAYSVALSPAITAYTAGQIVGFMANFDNTGAATLDVNGLGAATIKKNYNADVDPGDIKNGQLVTVMYDGTNFQMLSQLGNASAGCQSAGAAGSISGSASIVPGGSGYVYAVSSVANATGYNWQLPYGAYITSGFNTNSITVSFAVDAQPGSIYVYGYNSCSNGSMSAGKAISASSPLLGFVSANAYDPTTSISSRDAACQSDASASGLTGTYKAWVANGSGNNVPSTTNKYYKLVDGTIIANDWADLTDGSIGNPFNLQANGNSYNGNVWTGISSSGTVSGADCSGWSSIGASGTYGNTASTGSAWTDNGSTACGSSSSNVVGHVFDGCPCSLYGPGTTSCGAETGGYQSFYGYDGSCNYNYNGHNGWIKCCQTVTTPTAYRHYCVQQ